MNDEETRLAREIHKVVPSEGDVIAVKVPKGWDNRQMWDALKEIRDQGIQVVAFTEDVELSVIKDNRDYLLTVDLRLTEEQIERIKAEWDSYFPKAKLMIVTGGASLTDVTPDDPATRWQREVLDELGHDDADDITTL